MAKMQKLEGQMEINCSAQKIFEMRTTDSEIPKLCSHKVPSVVAQQGDSLNVGSTRRLDFILDGKQDYLVDRIEEVDEKKMIIRRSVIEGDIMKNYRTLMFQVQVIPKGNDSCLVKCSFEYEKMNEVAPEPKKLLDFSLGVLKDLVVGRSPAP